MSRDEALISINSGDRTGDWSGWRAVRNYVLLFPGFGLEAQVFVVV